VGADNAQVGGFVANWYYMDRDEEHGVGARSGGHALGQAMDFDNIGCPPVGAVRTLTQGSILCEFASVRVECIAMECHVCAAVGSMDTWRPAWHLGRAGADGHACWLGPAFGAGIAGGHCDVIRILRDDVWTVRWYAHHWVSEWDYGIGCWDYCILIRD